MKPHKLLFLIIAVMGMACENDGDNMDSMQAINGHWEMKTDENQVELYIDTDSTFHVDVLSMGGIEVEGRLVLEDRQITFINTHGTDSIASDPAPGIYKYSIESDTLSFDLIDDPLDRRAGFMTQPWIRVEQGK